MSKNTLKIKNVKLEENSELEIFNALKETLKVNFNSTKLQKKFISLLPSYLSFSYSPSLVCNSFLKKNKFFLKEKSSNNQGKN